MSSEELFESEEEIRRNFERYEEKPLKLFRSPFPLLVSSTKIINNLLFFFNYFADDAKGV